MTFFIPHLEVLNISILTCREMNIYYFYCLGDHTIGRDHCTTFSSCLFNFNASNNLDPTIQSSLLQNLQSLCPYGNSDANTMAPLDTVTKDWFDNVYFKNIQKNMGLLQLDQLDQVLFSTTNVWNAIFLN